VRRAVKGAVMAMAKIKPKARVRRTLSVVRKDWKWEGNIGWEGEGEDD
jgi:hypothetical protein